jgi:hypothetical protein
MTLDDLLLELRENILHDRSDRVSGNEDQLWSDTTLVRYIDEAQRRFARQTMIIRDGTTASVTQVTLVANTNSYALHSSVIAVISAHLAGDTADLARAGHSNFDTYHVPDTYFFDPSQLSTLPPGKPLAFDTDEFLREDANNMAGPMNLRVFPIPSATYAGQIISLRVARLPLKRFELKELTAVPEIPEDYHLQMLDWAAYLALRIVDHDLGDPMRAEEYKKSFEATVEQARKEVWRKIFTPLQWGFGRNGFSWTMN